MKRRKQNPWPFTPKALSPRNTTAAHGGIASRVSKRPAATPKRREREAPRAVEAIDEKKLATHFAKGGTLAEFLRQNPGADRQGVTDRAHRYRAQKNVTGPRKCVLCKSTRDLGVMHLDGNESDDEPKNLAWGCRSCNGILSAAFKRIGAGRPTNQYNPARGVPTFAQYSWAVSQGGPGGHHYNGGAHDEAGAIIHATPKSKRIEYARRIGEGQKARRREADDARWNPAARIAVKDVRYDKEQNRTYIDVQTPEFRKEYYVSGYVPKVKALGFIRERAERELRQFRGNPADLAARGYEEFHGAPPTEYVEVKERVHVHRHLSGAGTLERLIVDAIDGKGSVTIRGFKGALLAFNERKNQLFITGGDQAVDLKAFGIKPAEAHELETLGKVISLDYATVKTHLGDEGGDALYRHKLRTTNENGRHVTVRIARYPDLIYRVRDKKLEFSGGSYTIIAEGIDR